VCTPWMSLSSAQRHDRRGRLGLKVSHPRPEFRPLYMRFVVRAIAALLGLLTAVVGVWALSWPDSFSDFVNFPPHRHFLHDVGAFQLGIGVTLLVATIWADALATALAGYLVGGAAHTVAHAVDADLGGSTGQTVFIGLSSALAAVALVARWRQLGRVHGGDPLAGDPPR
jgi:hypothetical protein